MGKAQSKRSVDITTETKKGAEDEITEKMEKIEDLDKKETVNGDATVQEKQDLEKKDSDEVENDKDMTTEKNVDIQAGGDSTEASNSVETPKEESGSANAEEISPLADESVKKSKKEKVKKKWSFRSISFGKKDKQKPTKSEEAVEDGTTATNGAENDEKASKETEDTQKEKSVKEVEEGKPTESHENGDASQQELNGTEHNEEKPSEEKTNDLTANLTNNTTTTTATEKSGPVQSETTVESSNLSEKTEVTAVPTTINIDTNISENNSTAAGVSKNDNGESEKSNATEQESQKLDVTINESNETSTEKTSTLTDATNNLTASTNGEVVEEIHQNGDNIDQEVVEQSKAQIEVNFNTDNKVSAATLDSFPSTSINPSKVQIQNQDLNTTTTKVDESFKINNDEESVVSKFTDIEKKEENIILSSIRENVNTTYDIEKKEENIILSSISENVNTVEEEEDIDSNKQIEQIAEIIESEKSETVENITEEPTPPPLPISPPPSHVSVFAFTNNEESVKDSLSTNNSETVCPLIDEENKEILPSHLQVLPDDSANITDIPENQEKSDETTKIVDNELNETDNDHTSSICKEELQKNLKTDSILDEFENKDEFTIAAEVIDEITDKAVEVVSRQLESKENIEEDISLQETKLEEEGNEEDINDEIVMEVIKNIVDQKEHAADEGNDDDASLCKKEELTNCLLEPTVALNQTNDTITESSLIMSASDSIQQQAQNEMFFLKVEEHLNPTKEFGSAKDLKDNVAAAEITQDLSVTCE